VAVVATRCRVFAGKRIGRVSRMIKADAFPAQSAVTGLAARRKATLVRVILRVTADTGLGRAFESLAGMT